MPVTSFRAPEAAGPCELPTFGNEALRSSNLVGRSLM